MADFGFIGRGWDFPPTFRKDTCSVEMLVGKDEIQSSIEILLSTATGQRVMRPEYGLNMETFIFEPAAASMQTLMLDAVEKAFALHEPRVNLNRVDVEAVPEEGLLRVLIDYTIAGTNTRLNIVYPFYIEEGSDIAPQVLPPRPIADTNSTS